MSLKDRIIVKSIIAMNEVHRTMLIVKKKIKIILTIFIFLILVQPLGAEPLYQFQNHSVAQQYDSLDMAEAVLNESKILSSEILFPDETVRASSEDFVNLSGEKSQQNLSNIRKDMTGGYNVSLDNSQSFLLESSRGILLSQSSVPGPLTDQRFPVIQILFTQKVSA